MASTTPGTITVRKDRAAARRAATNNRRAEAARAAATRTERCFVVFPHLSRVNTPARAHSVRRDRTQAHGGAWRHRWPRRGCTSSTLLALARRTDRSSALGLRRRRKRRRALRRGLAPLPCQRAIHGLRPASTPAGTVALGCGASTPPRRSRRPPPSIRRARSTSVRRIRTSTSSAIPARSSAASSPTDRAATRLPLLAGSIFVGSEFGAFYALNSDCTVGAFFQTGSPIESSPNFASGNSVLRQPSRHGLRGGNGHGDEMVLLDGRRRRFFSGGGFGRHRLRRIQRHQAIRAHACRGAEMDSGDRRGRRVVARRRR